MPKKNKTGQLFICGLGIDKHNDITLGTIKALKSCDAVYYIHTDGARVRELLKNICCGFKYFDSAEFRSLTDPERVKIVGAEICRELEKGRKIGYLTYGNPLLWSDGCPMLSYCEARGHKAIVVTAPSSLDSILSLMAEDYRIFSRGFQMCNAESFIDRPESLMPASACVILCAENLISKGDFDRFCEKVEGMYPKDRRIYLVKCGDGSAGSCLVPAKVKDLRRMKSRISHMMSLVLPGIY